MRKIRFALLALAMALAIAPAAKADTFSFSFWGNGISGSGTLTGSELSPGVFNILGGFLTTAGGNGFTAGTFNLLSDANPGATAYSPSNYFYYDDLLTLSGNPMVTEGGLLFTVGGIEYNLFSLGAGQYILYENNGANEAIYFDVSETPEPSSLLLFGTGLLCLALGRYWMSKPRTPRRALIA